MRKELSAVLVCAAFWLGIRNGHIVWTEGNRLHDTGVPESSLTNLQDRELLQSGLLFDGRAGLTRALEDFCS